VLQSAVVFALPGARGYLYVLPLLSLDLLIASVPLRAIIRALFGLALFGAFFALAILFTNRNGRELLGGLAYSEGLEDALLLLCRVFFLGLASQASLYRFGRAAAFRALAILLAPLQIFGISGPAAARAVYRALGLIPKMLPLLAAMLRNRRIELSPFFALRGGAAGGRSALRSQGRARFFVQSGVCLLWLAFACALLWKFLLI